MRVIYALLKKEALENKFVLYIIVFFSICSFILSIKIFHDPMSFALQICNKNNIQDSLMCESFSHSRIYHLDFIEVLNYLGKYSTLFITMIIVVSYFSKTLLRERVSGSAIFWRRMPVDQSYLIGVKVFFGVVLLPLFCSLIFLIQKFIGFILRFEIIHVVDFYSQSFFKDTLFEMLEYIYQIILFFMLLLPFLLSIMCISNKSNWPLLMLTITIFLVMILPIIFLDCYEVNNFIGSFLSELVKIFSNHFTLQSIKTIGYIGISIYLAIGVIMWFFLIKSIAYVSDR